MKPSLSGLALALVFALFTAQPALSVGKKLDKPQPVETGNSAVENDDSDVTPEDKPDAQLLAVDDMARSIVKIYATAETHSTYAPWNSDTESRIGTGFIIEGNRILTNAHVVADQTFIELQRDGKPERFEAELLFISHEADLALLTVKDRSFFNKEGKEPYLSLGELPKVHQEISVYGFPTGGDTLSVTKGIISRIEYIEYAHSGLSFQGIQIDAAINPGNSGGPALADGKVVGVAMQVAGNGEENIGYMIPTSVIYHFLKDMEDGKYDGFADFSAVTEDLINPALRKKHKLGKDQTGVLVTRVCADTSAEKLLKVGDIITSVDGHKVENNGTVLFQPGKYIDFEYRVDQHQLNELLPVEVIRAGEPLKLEIPMDKAATTSYSYDARPRYLVYGGYVFTPSKVPEYCQSRDELDKEDQQEKTENVLITKVLASSSNAGFHDLVMNVSSVNGEKFNNFTGFYTLLKQARTEFITLEDDNGFQVVIDRKVAEAEHDELLKRYNMEAGQSDDLLELDQKLAQAAKK